MNSISENINEGEKVSRLAQAVNDYSGDFSLHALDVMAATFKMTEEKKAKYRERIRMIPEVNIHIDDIEEDFHETFFEHYEAIISSVDGLEMTVPDFVSTVVKILKQQLPLAEKLRSLDKELNPEEVFSDISVPEELYGKGGLPGYFAMVITQDILYRPLLGKFIAIKDTPQVSTTEKIELLQKIKQFALSFNKQIELLNQKDIPTLSKEGMALRAVATHELNTQIEITIMSRVDNFIRELNKDQSLK